VDKRYIHSDETSTSAEKKRLVITLEQQFVVTECGDSNCQIGGGFGMHESKGRIIIKLEREIK
jgi:hypothetical protein